MKIKMTECTIKNLNCGWCMGAGVLAWMIVNKVDTKRVDT